LIVLFALPAVFQLMLRVSAQLLRVVRRNAEIITPRATTTFWENLIPPLCAMMLWTINGIAFWLFVRSVTEIPIEMLPACIGMNAAAYFIGYASFITPSGLGFREASLAFFLGAFFPAPVAVAIAFLARLWSIAGELVGVGIAVLGKPTDAGGRTTENASSSVIRSSSSK
jgi:uncharacterized membrane protein YbhN (UPF0104 family)